MAGMKGNNFYQAAVVGNALNPQSVSGATVNGGAILEPWRTGRQLALILLGGTLAVGSSGRAKIQGRKRSDGSWVQLKQYDGTTDLEFTATLLDDAAGLENGAILGTLDLDYIDSVTYSSVRVAYTEEGAAAQVVGIAYVIYDLYTHPGTQTDDLAAKQRA